MNRRRLPGLLFLLIMLLTGGYLAWQKGWLNFNATGKSALAGHTAVYRMSLIRLRQGDHIADMQGRTLYSLEDSCNGWTVRQKMITRFDAPDAPSAFITSFYNTWEAKDGKEFSFAMQRMRNQQLSDNLRGRVEIGEGKSPTKLSLIQPMEAAITLGYTPEFPTHQTEKILQAAQHGLTQLNIPLFDGSELDAGYDVNVHIQPASDKFWPHEFNSEPLNEQEKNNLAAKPAQDGNALPDDPLGTPDQESPFTKDLEAIRKDADAEQQAEMGNKAPKVDLTKPDVQTKAKAESQLDQLENKAVKVPGKVDMALLNTPQVWRINMATYSKPLPPELKSIQNQQKSGADDDNTSEDPAEQVQVELPLYEMQLTMHDNGIVSDYTIDYPEFSVHGELVGLSANPPACR